MNFEQFMKRREVPMAIAGVVDFNGFFKISTCHYLLKQTFLNELPARLIRFRAIILNFNKLTFE